MKKLILLALVSFSLNIHSQIELKYLGTAGWEISDDNITVLIDPYISRVKLGSGPSVNKLDKRKTVLRSDFFVSDSIPTRGSSVVVFERVRASHNSISTLLTNHLAVMRQLTFNIREYAAIMRKFTESPYLHCGVAQYWHKVFLEIQNSNSAEGVSKQYRWKSITE